MNLFENRIGGIEPFTLIDFPNKIAGILFYTNCNLHCPYCYNVELVKNICTKLNSNDVLNFIKKRKNKLDGFVFSGGECTIHGNNLINDIIFVKNAGFDIKVDTNGTNPDVIQKLLNLNLVNYFALDYKAPINKKDLFFSNIQTYDNFIKTLSLLNSSKIPFEIRTTVHTDIIDENDINSILKHLESINYKGNYYIQFYFKTKKTLGNVSNNPRYFDITKIINKKNINIQYRNIEANI